MFLPLYKSTTILEVIDLLSKYNLSDISLIFASISERLLFNSTFL